MSPFCSHSSLVHFVIPSLPLFLLAVYLYVPLLLAACLSLFQFSISPSVLQYLLFVFRVVSYLFPSLTLFDCRWPCMFSPSLIASINHASRLRGIVLHTLPAQSVTSVNLLPQSPLRQLFLAIVGSRDLPLR